MRFYSLVHFCIPAQISKFTHWNCISVLSEERDNTMHRKTISHLLDLPFQNVFWEWSEFHLYPQQPLHHFSAKQKNGQVSCFSFGNHWQDCIALWKMLSIFMYLLFLLRNTKVLKNLIFLIKIYSLCVSFYWGMITANFDTK